MKPLKYLHICSIMNRMDVVTFWGNQSFTSSQLPAEPVDIQVNNSISTHRSNGVKKRIKLSSALRGTVMQQLAPNPLLDCLPTYKQRQFKHDWAIGYGRQFYQKQKPFKYQKYRPFKLIYLFIVIIVCKCYLYLYTIPLPIHFTYSCNICLWSLSLRSLFTSNNHKCKSMNQQAWPDRVREKIRGRRVW